MAVATFLGQTPLLGRLLCTKFPGCHLLKIISLPEKGSVSHVSMCNVRDGCYKHHGTFPCPSSDIGSKVLCFSSFKALQKCLGSCILPLFWAGHPTEVPGRNEFRIWIYLGSISAAAPGTSTFYRWEGRDGS